MCRIGKTFGPINFRHKSRAQSDCVAAGVSPHPARNRLARIPPFCARCAPRSGENVPPPRPKSPFANSAVFVPGAHPVSPTWPKIVSREFPRFVPYQEPRADCNSESTARQCEHSVCYSVSTASVHLQPPRSPAAAAPQPRCSRSAVAARRRPPRSEDRAGQ